MSQLDPRAKEPVWGLVAGPYGHPFHPVLVTVPIGAWVSSLVFDLASQVGAGSTDLVSGARWLVGIGVLGGLAAGLVGFLDYIAIPTGTRAHRTALTHMLLNLGVIGAYAGNFAWRTGTHPAQTPAGPLALSVVSLGALSVAGVLGGRLTFRYGVRVASEATQAEGFVPTDAPTAPTAPTLSRGD